MMALLPFTFAIGAKYMSVLVGASPRPRPMMYRGFCDTHANRRMTSNEKGGLRRSFQTFRHSLSTRCFTV
jgi:hypothetical protein